MSRYGGLTLTITGLVGVGVVIVGYPQWLFKEILRPPTYNRMARLFSGRRSSGLDVAAGEGGSLLEGHAASTEVVRPGGSVDAVGRDIEAGGLSGH